MKLVPLNDRIIVRRTEAAKVTPGGILIPDSAKERPRRGEVLAVGPGTVNDSGLLVPVNVKVGQIVLFSAYSGNDVSIDKEEYLVLNEADVLAVIE